MGKHMSPRSSATHHMEHTVADWPMLITGEYVAVEKLEETYKSVSLVEQVWVYGNSFESTLIAVVVPVESELMSWAKSAGLSGGFAEVCRDPHASKHVLEQLVSAAKAGRLKVGPSSLSGTPGNFPR